MTAKNSGKSGKREQRGSTYLLVLTCSMLVTVIGLASLLATRVQRRSAQMAEDSTEARFCAQTAVELGLLFVMQDPNWRDNRSNGTWVSNQPLGTGSYTLQGTDPQDADIDDSEYDPLILTGVGNKGIARHKTQVTLAPQIRPLAALNTCLQASGQVTVSSGSQIAVVNAPLSTNGALDNGGVIDGDVNAASVINTGTIRGVLTSPSGQKAMPDSLVISQYIAKATVIPFTGTIDEKVLAPSYNPWGAGNSDGVYYLSTGGNDLTIKDSRIYGTLVINANGKKVVLEDSLCMQKFRSDYPVLIVNGNLEIHIDSADYPLSEWSEYKNFNPSGAPYQGQTDVDIWDVYPNEIQGLVYVVGSLKLRHTAKIVGAVICQGPVQCDGINTIIHDPTLYSSPPEGYTFVECMNLSPGSWKQTVD